jgi:hypothetical protein
MARYLFTIAFDTDDLIEDVEDACAAAFVQLEDPETITTSNVSSHLTRASEYGNPYRTDQEREDIIEDDDE